TFSAQIAGRDTGGTDGGTLDQERRHAYVMSFGGTYNNGPISAAIAYEVHNNLRSGAVAACTTCPVDPNAKRQDQGLTIAGAYTFGAFKIAAVGEWLKYDTPVAVGSTSEVKRNLWGISGTANIGPGQAYAAYFKANNGRGATCFTNAAGITSC